MSLGGIESSSMLHDVSSCMLHDALACVLQAARVKLHGLAHGAFHGASGCTPVVVMIRLRLRLHFAQMVCAVDTCKHRRNRQLCFAQDLLWLDRGDAELRKLCWGCYAGHCVGRGAVRNFEQRLRSGCTSGQCCSRCRGRGVAALGGVRSRTKWSHAFRVEISIATHGKHRSQLGLDTIRTFLRCEREVTRLDKIGAIRVARPFMVSRIVRCGSRRRGCRSELVSPGERRRRRLQGLRSAQIFNGLEGIKPAQAQRCRSMYTAALHGTEQARDLRFAEVAQEDVELSELLKCGGTLFSPLDPEFIGCSVCATACTSAACRGTVESAFLKKPTMLRCPGSGPRGAFIA